MRIPPAGPRGFLFLVGAGFLLAIPAVRAEGEPEPPDPARFAHPVFRHLLLARDGDVIIGKGRPAKEKASLRHPIVSVNMNPPDHPSNPGIDVPLPHETNQAFLREGLTEGSGADVGTWTGGSVFLDIDRFDHDKNPATPPTNPLEGDVFARERVKVTGYGQGARVTGKILRGGGVTDFDGDGQVETFRRELDGKYPDFAWVPAGDAAEALTGGNFSGFYLEEFAAGSADRGRTFEFRLLRYIGNADDEKRAAAAAGTFTKDRVNLRRNMEQARRRNDNELVLQWAEANGQTDQIQKNLDGTISIGIYKGPKDQSRADSLDLLLVKGGKPLVLYLDQVKIHNPVQDDLRTIRVPSGTMLAVTGKDGTVPGVSISGCARLEFIETGGTPPDAENRIYVAANESDADRTSIRFWMDEPEREYKEVIYAEGDTFIVTDGTFNPSNRGAISHLPNGNLSIFTGAKSGTGGSFRVPEGDLSWFSYNTPDRWGTSRGPAPSFEIGKNSHFCAGGDIFLAVLGTLKIRNGGRIFAGGGGGGNNETNPADRIGGSFPSNPLATTRIFSGYKGGDGHEARFALGGGAEPTFLNSRMSPRNTTWVAKGLPGAGFGVMDIGSGEFYGNVLIYAPDYVVQAAQVQEKPWNFRGSLVVRAFPDDQDLVLDQNLKRICGELTGNRSLTFDAGVLDDMIPPHLKVPEEITVEAVDSTGAMLVIPVTATDNYGGKVRIRMEPVEELEYLPPGTSNVTVIATDDYGNETKAVVRYTVILCAKPELLEIPAYAGWEGLQHGNPGTTGVGGSNYEVYRAVRETQPKMYIATGGYVGQIGDDCQDFTVYRLGFSFEAPEFPFRTVGAQLDLLRGADFSWIPWYIRPPGCADWEPTNDEFQVLWGRQPLFPGYRDPASFKLVHTRVPYHDGTGDSLVQIGGKTFREIMADTGSNFRFRFPLNLAALDANVFMNPEGATDLILMANRDYGRSPPEKYTETKILVTDPVLRLFVVPHNAVENNLIGRPIDFGYSPTVQAKHLVVDFDRVSRTALSAWEEDDNPEDEEHDLSAELAMASAAPPPGLFVGLNADDDNRNFEQDFREGNAEIQDITQHGQKFQEDDLQLVEWKLGNIPSGAKIFLGAYENATFPLGRIRIWKSRKRGPEPPLLDWPKGQSSKSVTLSLEELRDALPEKDGPFQLWIEGTNRSNAQRDIRLVAAILGPADTFLCKDILEMTVVGVRLLEDLRADRILETAFSFTALTTPAFLEKPETIKQALNRHHLHVFAPPGVLQPTLPAAADRGAVVNANLFSFDAKGFYWKDGPKGAFSGIVENPEDSSQNYAQAETTKDFGLIHSLSHRDSGFYLVTNPRLLISSSEMAVPDTVMAAPGGRLIARTGANLLAQAGIRPPGWMVKTGEVRFVPATDINGDKPDEGSVPNIPMNAALPPSLSGTGKPGEVEMRLKLSAPPGTYSFQLSVPPEKAALNTDTVTVEVPSDGTTVVANVPITVAAKTRSVNPTDTIAIQAALSPSSAPSCLLNLISFDFVVGVADSGIPNTTPDASVRAASATPKLPNFDGDRIVGFPAGKLKGFRLYGWEAPTEEMSFILTTEGSPLISCAGGNESWNARAIFNHSGGSSMAAYHDDDALGPVILYARTSSDWARLKGSLCDEGNLFLGNGDMTDMITFGAGHFRHRTTSINKCGKSDGYADLDDGGKRIPNSKYPHQQLSHGYREGVYLNGDHTSSSALLSPPAKPDPIETDLDQSAGAIGMRTDPPDAFFGKVSCNLLVSRTGSVNLYSTAETDNNLNSVLKVGTIVKLYLPPDLSKAVDALSSVITVEAKTGETHSVAATNMKIALDIGQEVIRNVDGTREIYSLISPLVRQSNGQDDPKTYVASANSVYGRVTTIIPANIQPLMCDFNVPVVFLLDKVTKQKTPTVWTNSVVATYKQDADGYGHAVLSLNPVQVEAVAPKGAPVPFEIWEMVSE